MTERHDVVVIGAGPVGLSLALGLARKGIDVLVLEKESGTAEHSRAPGIWARTQEILAALGILDRFLDEGFSLPDIELWDADRERVLLGLPVSELRDESDCARLLILPQSKTERLLCEAVRETATGEVRFNCEAVQVVQRTTDVEVRFETGGREKSVIGRFVAGCDGAHSTVRAELGGTLEGITYGVRAALADVRIDHADDLRFPRLTTRPNLAIAIRIDARLWRLILPFSPDGPPVPLDERIANAMRKLFPPVEYESVWESEFSLHRRVSTVWTEGRVVLAGDAAHLNSPVGGEGMNAGIIDAALLTETILRALEGDDPGPLEAYTEQRRQDIEAGVNRFTDLMTRLLLGGRGRFIRPVMRTVDLILKIPPVRRRALRKVAMIDRQANSGPN